MGIFLYQNPEIQSLQIKGFNIFIPDLGANFEYDTLMCYINRIYENNSVILFQKL